MGTEEEKRERDLQLLSRGKFASTMKEYLEEWQRRELTQIDTQARKAMTDGDLDKSATQLWIQRLAILKLVTGLTSVERAATGASARLEQRM
jgi:hypothetical protein